MPTEVILPRVDMDMTTGKIARWYVEEGQPVEKGKPLFEIETDKAAMEIEAPVSGIVRDIAAVIGEDTPVGQAVAWIFAADEPYGARPTGRAARPAAPKAASAIAETPQPSAAALPRATPLARRLAREFGIDLKAALGSGPHGRVQSGDIRVLAEARASEPPAAAKSTPATVAAPDPCRTGLRQAWLRQGRGRPVLMLHGFGAELGAWRPVLSGLDYDRPILALDLPGHGGSPLGQVASFDDLVCAVEDHLAAQDILTLDLVGHSLGGAVATALAARGRIDARSLLLFAPAGLGPEIDGDFLDGFGRAASEASLEPWLRRLVDDPAALPPGLARATLRARSETDIGAAQRSLRASLFPDGTQAFGTRDLFGRIHAPTKIVFGLEDRIIPARQAFGLPGTVALHLFAATGHLPHIERRAETSRLWTELLNTGAQSPIGSGQA